MKSSILHFALALPILGSIAHADSAGRIGLIGFYNSTAIVNTFTNLGYEVVDAPSSATYGTFDAIIMLRTTGSQELIDFVNAGGLLVTEWSASQWVLNTAQLLGTTRDTGGGLVATGTVVTFTTEGTAAGLSTNIGASYAEGSNTEFFRDFSPIDATTTTVYATRPGNIPVIIGGTYGAGAVLVLGYDWADHGYAANGPTANLILNAFNFTGSPIPEPGSAALFLGAGAFGVVALRRRRAA